MNREDIIRMALEAGFMLSTNYGEGPHKLQPVSDSVTLKRFAALVAAAEREACAAICDAYGMPDGTSTTADALAKAIRARGETK